MGSVIVSEVLNDIPPWSNMIDARSHRTEQAAYDSSNAYRTTPNSSSAPSSSRRQTPQHGTPHRTQPTSNPRPTSENSSKHDPSQDVSEPTHIASSSASTSQQNTQRSPAPNSPHLAPSHSPQSHMSSTSPAPNSEAGPGPTPTNASSQPPSPHAQDYDDDSPPRVKVRDLRHIQSFALENVDSNASSTAESEKSYSTSPQYEISEMPITDIIEMVAGLLTKITATNDQHYEHLHRQISPPESNANTSSQTTSVLAFHGKNVPSISILSYLTRIHKYCPATWEVFLSLLVYFDRMTERVNSGPIQSLRQANQEFMDRSAKNSQVSMTEAAEDAQLETTDSDEVQTSTSPVEETATSSSEEDDSDSPNLSHFFVVDSFNIHRLVIAGVTCAAKYFSDIFFTNSRYAKVGGLPLVELNHLELQFLVLNDFRLAVPVEELEAYATMLVEFYAREVAAQNQIEKIEGVEMVTR